MDERRGGGRAGGGGPAGVAPGYAGPRLRIEYAGLTRWEHPRRISGARSNARAGSIDSFLKQYSVY